jgi:peptidoglycan/LPS O-acetylase OafA/YrhL
MTAMRELPSLTPLRGIAAVAVLLFHVSAGHDDPTMPLLLRRGYLGVDLFFVLSGLVLAHVYVRDFLGPLSWRRAGAFLWNRLARIYPLHFLIMFFLVAVGWSQYRASDVAGNFLLLQVPLPVIAINLPSWSLSAEWWAYLVFPLLAHGLWRLDGRMAAALCVLLLAALELMIVLVFGDFSDTVRGWGALARSLPEFLLGMLTYRAFSDPWLGGWWRRDWVLAAIAVALVATLALLPNDGIVVALLPPLLLAAVSNAGIGTRLLNARPLRWLGDISYSVYLGQVFAFSAAAVLAASPAVLVLGLNGLRAFTLAMALCVGALLYRCVEVPCRSFLRDAPGRVRDVLAPAA